MLRAECRWSSGESVTAFVGFGAVCGRDDAIAVVLLPPPPR